LKKNPDLWPQIPLNFNFSQPDYATYTIGFLDPLCQTLKKLSTASKPAQEGHLVTISTLLPDLKMDDFQKIPQNKKPP